MKKLIIVTALICLYDHSFAQNESYLGGIGDGYALTSQVSVFSNPISFQPYIGGNADGYSADTVIVFPQHGYIPMFQPYSGGQADGWTGLAALGIIIVPVELLSFTGEQIKNEHILHWSTSQEQNSSHFDLERSADSRHFSALGTITAAGNSATQRNYNYTDELPMQGDNFYRLRMVNTDGSAKYSNIILLKRLGNAVISIYPNPTARTLKVMLNGVANNSKLTATIFDINGKYVQGKVLMQAGASLEFDVEHLARGMYMLKLEWDQQVSTLRFIKE